MRKARHQDENPPGPSPVPYSCRVYIVIFCCFVIGLKKLLIERNVAQYSLRSHSGVSFEHFVGYCSAKHYSLTEVWRLD